MSPLFIGGGEDTKLSRLDYIYDSSKEMIYVLDQKKWINLLEQYKLLDDYLRRVMQEARRTRGGLDNYNYLVSRQNIFKRGLKDLIKQVTSREISVSACADGFRSNDIYCFIRNSGGMPYIPGSSIKGAIRTAIMSTYYGFHKKKADRDFNKLRSILSHRNKSGRRREIARASTAFENEIFDWQENHDGKSYTYKGMAGILVSDSEPFVEANLFLDRKRDIVCVEGGNGIKENRISVYREYAAPGTEVEFTLTIDTYKIKKDLGIDSASDIIRALNYRWDSLCGKKGIFSLWPGIDRYLPSHGSYENDTGLMILGGGAGFHSKSTVTSMAYDAKEAVSATKGILSMNFPRERHFYDRPISPRTLKVGRYKGQDSIVGVCRIGVV